MWGRDQMPASVEKAIAFYKDEVIHHPHPDAKGLIWCSDGQPASDLPQLTYGGTSSQFLRMTTCMPSPTGRSALKQEDEARKFYRANTGDADAHDMYATRRMGIIDTCVDIAQSHRAQCYVVTTGYGPVDAFQMRRPYNVPGQLAGDIPEHREFVIQRVRQLLSDMEPLPPIVFYAGKSTLRFRDTIWSALECFEDLRAVMFGARQHPTGWDLMTQKVASAVFGSGDEDLGALQRKWGDDNPRISPFFSVSAAIMAEYSAEE
jgi:hypothetical protein